MEVCSHFLLPVRSQGGGGGEEEEEEEEVSVLLVNCKLCICF